MAYQPKRRGPAGRVPQSRGRDAEGPLGAGWRRVTKLVVPREQGKGVVVKQGQVVRIIAIDGPQVCDFNAFNRKNPDEAFWSGGTRSLEGTHLTVGHRLW